MTKRRPRKLKWIEPGHYPKSERIHLQPADVKAEPKVRPVKGRKQKNPHHEEPRPKPIARPERKPDAPVNKRYVKLKNWVLIDGRRWEHITTLSQKDALILTATWDRAGIEYKARRIGNAVELYQKPTDRRDD